MKSFVNLLRRVVQQRPVVTIAVVVAITVGLGAAGTLAGRDDGNEAFAPDAAELTAFEEIGELFGEASDESAVQVIVGVPGGNAISADGAAALQAARDAVLASDLAPLLSTQPGRPEFISYLGPVEQLAETIPAGAGDDAVREAFARQLASLPEDQAGFVVGLLADGSDAQAAQAEQGLMLFFFQAGGLEDEVVTDALADMAERVDDADTAGAEVEVFSFGLLFSDQDEFEQETGRLFMLAGLIIVLILLFVFWVKPKGRLSPLGSLRRSAADMGLTIATIIMSITWMFGIGALLGPGGLGLINDPNPMTDIVPILIIGLGVDYSIHLSSRYKEEIADGAGVSRSIGMGIRTVGIALALATITTAVGFLTNVVNPVPALVVFGVYASVGIGAAFILMLTFVASVRLLLDRRAERAGRLPAEALGANQERLLPSLIGRLSLLAERVPAATVAIALALGGLGVWGATNIETRFSVTDFVPEDNIALAALETLQEDFGGGLGETTNVVVSGDVATVDAHNAMVAAQGNLADSPDVVQFNGAPAVDSPLGVLAGAVNPDSPTFDAGLAGELESLGLGPDLTVRPGTDVGAIYDAAFETTALASYLHRNAPGAYDAALFNVTTQAGEERVKELRVTVADDFAPVESAGLTAVATSDNIITDVVREALESSQLSSLVITLLAAMALLVVNFWIEARRPFLGIITIFPVVLVVLWVFGLMAATGIPFGPVTATIAAIAIGIGVPYTIHVAHRFQEDRIRRDTPEDAIHSTVRNTGGALAGSAFTTAAGFGILMTSSTVPFQQFGRVSVYAITLALAAAVLVLPSMLILWDRWHRRRGEAPLDVAAVEAVFDGDARVGEPQPALD